MSAFNQSAVWGELVTQLDNNTKNIEDTTSNAVVVSVLDALTNLTCSQEQVEFYHSNKVDFTNTVNTLNNVLRRHGLEPAVVNAFLWCFRNLSAVYHESNHLLFPALVGIAETHRTDKDIFTLMCQCVSNLCLYRENRVVLGEYGVCEKLVDLYVLHCTEDSIAHHNNKHSSGSGGHEVSSSVTEEVDEEVLAVSDAIMSAMRDVCEGCEQNRLKMRDLLNDL
jgi:hypothetical protein